MRYLLKSLFLFGAIVNLYGQDIDPGLLHHFNQFKVEAEKRGVPLNLVPGKMVMCLKFSTSETDSIFWINKVRPNMSYNGATVFLHGTQDPYIFINPKAYLVSDETGREITVFHELFHAYFDADHDPNDCIMKPDISNSDALYYKLNREKVLDSIFKKIKNEKGIIPRSAINNIF